MTQSPAELPTNHPLDRRAALGVLLGLQIPAMLLVPSLWNDLSFGRVGPWPIDSLMNAWMLTACICTGFFVAFGPRLWVVRLAVSPVLCGGTVLAYSAGKAMAGSYRGEPPYIGFLIALLVASETAAGLAIYRTWTGVSLHNQKGPLATARRRGQFLLADLMQLTLAVAATLGICQFLGPFSGEFAPLFATWQFWLGMLVPAAAFAALGIACTLTAFSRLRPLLLVIAAIAIASADAFLFLAIFVPLNRWADEAVGNISMGLLLKFLFVVGCTIAMRTCRWLGYELQPPAKSPSA